MTDSADDHNKCCLAENDCLSTQRTRRSIQLSNKIAEVERLYAFLLSVCAELNIDGATVKTVSLALEEAVVNVINYAYPKGVKGSIEVIAYSENSQLILNVIDNGVAFDPTKVADADIHSSLEERIEGGLGIYLMRNLMDDVRYERTACGQNILTLIKRINI